MAIESLELLLTNIFGLLQIIALLLATYWGYRIYEYNRLKKLWLLLPLATALLTLRRTFILLKFNYFETLIGKYFLLERVLLPCIVAALIALALYEMKKQFESFRILEKESKKKAKVLQKK